jgi:hypothetical protein
MASLHDGIKQRLFSSKVFLIHKTLEVRMVNRFHVVINAERTVSMRQMMKVGFKSFLGKNLEFECHINFFYVLAKKVQERLVQVVVLVGVVA